MTAGNKEDNLKLAIPYRPIKLVGTKDSINDIVLKKHPTELTWQSEVEWVNEAWGGGREKALEELEKSMAEATLALNLFDRAAQHKNPGEIAKTFREILSVNVAVAKPEDLNLYRTSFDFEEEVTPLQQKLNEGKLPQTSSVSLGGAYKLRNESNGKVAVIRFEEDKYIIKQADYIKPDDLLVVPSTAAYLHLEKGLCFQEKENPVEADGIATFNESEWLEVGRKGKLDFGEGAGFQTLKEHTFNVMDGTLAFLQSEYYKNLMEQIFQKLEPSKDAKTLTEAVTQLIYLAAGFHDLGKADKAWQKCIREIDKQIQTEDLVGRSGSHKSSGKRRRLPPHTPPGYNGFIKAAKLLLGDNDSYDYLIKAIALAAVRHHSSLMHPSSVKGKYRFVPEKEKAEVFLREVLSRVEAPETIIEQIPSILIEAESLPNEDEVPLLFPNDDLFAIYALAGRAILLADRADASGKTQDWL